MDGGDFTRVVVDEVGNFALVWTGAGDMISGLTGQALVSNFSGFNATSGKSLNTSQ